MEKIKSFLQKFKDQLFPKNYTCLICKCEIESGKIFCKTCNEKLPYKEDSRCLVCGRPLILDEGVCLTCQKNRPFFNKGFSVFEYGGKIHSLILSYKAERKTLKHPFACLMKSCYEKANLTVDSITFVPCTKKTLKMRGYNQSLELAQELANMLNVPLSNAFEKKIDTTSQKTLNYDKRMKNLQSAFKVTEKVKGKTFLIVDDIMTTGATLNTLSKLLFEKGAKEVFVMTIAATKELFFK